MSLFNPVWSGGSSTSVATLLAYTLIDASIWAYAGYIFFKVVYDRKGSIVPAFLLALVLTELVHQLWWFSTYWIMNTREAAIINVSADWILVGAGNLFFPYWWLSFGFVAVGFLAGMAARNIMGRGRGEETEE